MAKRDTSGLSWLITFFQGDDRGETRPEKYHDSPLTLAVTNNCPVMD
ncbi:MAG TPA: hypothetical protein VFG09_01870 [Thermodesulfovibrionales bacterium]|nr:hypothetical protein [Thermodesulfovibrionales bacterium]